MTYQELTSIHASSIGSDIICDCRRTHTIYFNPRFQYRKRHNMNVINDYDGTTSIHASSIGSDYVLLIVKEYIRDFNPRFQYRKRLITS